MVCKPINQINFKLEEMYDAIVWVIMTVRQASVFDANNFCHHISQLTHLMSGNIPHPERFDQMVHIEVTRRIPAAKCLRYPQPS